jgi:hypothetical protein
MKHLFFMLYVLCLPCYITPWSNVTTQNYIILLKFLDNKFYNVFRMLRKKTSCTHMLLYLKQYDRVYLFKILYLMHSLYKPWWIQEFEPPRFHDSRHMKVVMLSALHTARLYSPGNISVTHLCYILSELRGILRPEVLYHWKFPLTPLRIEPTTRLFL